MSKMSPHRPGRSDSPFQKSASSMFGQGTPTDSLKPKSPGKGNLRAPGTPSSGKRVEMATNLVHTRDIPTILGLTRTESTQDKDPPVHRGEKTPRSSWRAQYWKKATPWATDRDAYGGRTQYTTTIKPTSKSFNDQHEWHVEGYNKPPEETPQEIIQQLIAKLEQHCRSTFLLNRMFKVFDKDNSSTIDKEEMVAVLLTFSIELTEAQVDAIMNYFGATDHGRGKTEIGYAQFVKAIEAVARQHPLDSRQRRAGYMRRSVFSTSGDGNRLCTPGFYAPIGCPMYGSYYPEDSMMLNIHGENPRFHTGANSPLNVSKRRESLKHEDEMQALKAAQEAAGIFEGFDPARMGPDN